MKLELTDLPTIALAKLRIIGRYRVIIFIVFLAALYGYLVVQINSSTNAQPAPDSTTTVSASPHIDPTVVQQLQQLQDNSVSVQSLFNQARTNPFQ